MTKYMFLRKGGKAIHILGDITRNVYNAELILVDGEDESNWIGHFAEGYGFINVKFAKADCKEATDEEIKMWVKNRNCIIF